MAFESRGAIARHDHNHRCWPNKAINADGEKRRSALLFAAGYCRRWATAHEQEVNVV